MFSLQAAFRGFQARRQYKKIIWSVGVLEKAILRWRLKRKGFRGLQVKAEDGKQEDGAEEDFFRAGLKQAEERVERSVVRVQAMFRSKKAQEEYRRMKLAHSQAKVGTIQMSNVSCFGLVLFHMSVYFVQLLFVQLDLEIEDFLTSEVDLLPDI